MKSRAIGVRFFPQISLQAAFTSSSWCRERLSHTWGYCYRCQFLYSKRHIWNGHHLQSCFGIPALMLRVHCSGPDKMEKESDLQYGEITWLRQDKEAKLGKE